MNEPVNWKTHQSLFDGRVFAELSDMTDDVIAYNIMSGRFAFKQAYGDKDAMLDAVNVWQAEAKRRELHIGPRRVLPVFATTEGNSVRIGLAFECPACGCPHMVTTDVLNPNGSQWRWNGSYDKPTLTPDIYIFDDTHAKRVVCHLAIRNGQAVFGDDCPHALAGTEVDLPEV